MFLYYFFDFVLVIERLGDLRCTIYLHFLCINIYYLFDGLIIGAIRGEFKNKLLYFKYFFIKDFWNDNS